MNIAFLTDDAAGPEIRKTARETVDPGPVVAALSQAFIPQQQPNLSMTQDGKPIGRSGTPIAVPRLQTVALRVENPGAAKSR